MPNKPMKPCAKSMCPNLVNGNDKYCEEHKSLENKDKTINKDKRKQYDKERGSAASRGYNYKWQQYSKDFLKRNPKCIRCDEPATVVDHIIPHKGNKELFWARYNHQPLCKQCHDRKTVLEDGGFGNESKKS